LSKVVFARIICDMLHKSIFENLAVGKTAAVAGIGRTPNSPMQPRLSHLFEREEACNCPFLSFSNIGQSGTFRPLSSLRPGTVLIASRSNHVRIWNV
jgi:hypothetical protein